MVDLRLFNLCVSVPLQKLLPLIKILAVSPSTEIGTYWSSSGRRLRSLLSVRKKRAAFGFKNLFLNLLELIFFVFYLLPKSGFFDHINSVLLLLSLLFDDQAAIGVEIWLKRWVISVGVIFFSFLLDFSFELINFFLFMGKYFLEAFVDRHPVC
jgi:hypothetical protein